LSEGEASTLTAPPRPAQLEIFDRARPESSRGPGNLGLRLFGLLTLGLVAALVVWDLRRRGLPDAVTASELEPYAPYLLLVLPLLAALGMLVAPRPIGWSGLLLGAGSWAVLGAVWSAIWLARAGRDLLRDGSGGFGPFVSGLTWVPYTALLLFGLVILGTALVLRLHRDRTPCHSRRHQLLTLGTAVVALLGPFWVLALVPAVGLGLRRPHRAAALTWLGWLVQGAASLGIAALGQIPASGPPALVLRPSAPTVVLLCLPLLGVAVLTGALFAVRVGTCDPGHAPQAGMPTGGPPPSPFGTLDLDPPPAGTAGTGLPLGGRHAVGR
jgi:hypothetical protein